MTAAAALIQNAIKSSRVVIFSKTYCPYCTNAKRLFDSLGEKYELYELDNMGISVCCGLRGLSQHSR